MINIQPYLHKLEVLQEWVNARVDERLPLVDTEPLWIDMSAVPVISWEEILSIYRQTGIMLWSSTDPPITPKRPMTFEEYYEHKTKQS